MSREETNTPSAADRTPSIAEDLTSIRNLNPATRELLFYV